MMTLITRVACSACWGVDTRSIGGVDRLTTTYDNFEAFVGKNKYAKRLSR